MMCTHYLCRCARAAELTLIARRTREAHDFQEAAAIHDAEVTCRLIVSPPAVPAGVRS